MWMLWAVAACGPSGSGNGQDTGEVDLALDPGRLDFGFVPFFESAEQTLTIRNNGASDVFVAELVLSNPDTLAVRGFETPRLRPGEETQLTVEWTPSETGDL